MLIILYTACGVKGISTEFWWWGLLVGREGYTIQSKRNLTKEIRDGFRATEIGAGDYPVDGW